MSRPIPAFLAGPGPGGLDQIDLRHKRLLVQHPVGYDSGTCTATNSDQASSTYGRNGPGTCAEITPPGNGN